MKISHIANMTKIAAATALMLLAACGQEAAVGNAAGTDDAEIAASGTPENRDWVPAGLTLPQPHTVLQDTKLGLRTHLLQVGVQTDPTPEMPRWKSALEAAGYSIQANTGSDRLLFSNDKEEGQIAISQLQDGDGYMIQIDISGKGQ